MFTNILQNLISFHLISLDLVHGKHTTIFHKLTHATSSFHINHKSLHPQFHWEYTELTLFLSWLIDQSSVRHNIYKEWMNIPFPPRGLMLIVDGRASIVTMWPPLCTANEVRVKQTAHGCYFSTQCHYDMLMLWAMIPSSLTIKTLATTNETGF